MRNSITRVLIVGASVRPWVQSAMVAGFEFVGLDFFADWDARSAIECHGRANPRLALIRIARFQDVIDDPAIQQQIESCDSAILCGGFETRIELVNALEKQLRLLGPSSQQLGRLDDPVPLFELFSRKSLQVPEMKQRLSSNDDPAHWIAKSIRSSGGNGVRIASDKDSHFENRQVYFQRRIPGNQVSAVFASFLGPTGRQQTRLVGTTSQLVGESDFGARRFQYCGSLSHPPLDEKTLLGIKRAGVAIGKELGLIGLWGVDFVLSDSQAFPIDINPRLTASMECYESLFPDHRPECSSLLELHVRCCIGDQVSESEICALHDHWNADENKAEGKAVVFCRNDGYVSGDLLRFAQSRHHPQQFNSPTVGTWIVDIPAKAMKVRRGDPVLTIRTRMPSREVAREELRKTAAEVYRFLDVSDP